MQNQKIMLMLNKFRRNQSGESTLQLTAFFSALAVVVALMGAPVLEKASQEYAENRSFGIDQTITGSVNKAKRYTIRKSILDEQPEKK
ncbi:MAG: hypothetical protein AAF423_00175 [Pseudomonadota bacterium]